MKGHDHAGNRRRNRQGAVSNLRFPGRRHRAYHPRYTAPIPEHLHHTQWHKETR